MCPASCQLQYSRGGKLFTFQDRKSTNESVPTRSKNKLFQNYFILTLRGVCLFKILCQKITVDLNKTKFKIFAQLHNFTHTCVTYCRKNDNSKVRNFLILFTGLKWLVQSSYLLEIFRTNLKNSQMKQRKTVYS